jgi:hypothetical protein
MPVLDDTTIQPLRRDIEARADLRWQPLHRIEDTGGDLQVVQAALAQSGFERLLYAEGDSWFDKFTPIPMAGANLLDAVRSPFVAGVVDASHIGDEAREMVSGRQARQTKAMFDVFDFDLILLSAGGNDLKNVFSDLFTSRVLAAQGVKTAWSAHELARAPADHSAVFDGVIASIGRFIGLRDAARRDRTRAAPIVLHGYDHLQPRPAPATLLAGSKVGRGPWIYPALKEAGLSDAQMRAEARQVVDTLNRRLAALVAGLPNVYLIDQRGLLTPAEPGSTGASNDWLDEIHPTPEGFVKLARQRWDIVLASLL